MEENNPRKSGRVVAGRYRLGERVSAGTEFATFDAYDEQTQQAVVLKIVNPDLGDAPQVRRQFRSTMAVAAGIHHPCVVPVLDFGTDAWGAREVLYVVSEASPGGSLRDLLDRGRLLDPSQALVVGLDACKGLDAVHRAGLVHGDIRPATLLFGDDRRPRLADVGLAEVLRSVGADPATLHIDRVRYASPEQAQGLDAGPKGDVYALCLTLLESLSGSVPFEADSAVATLAARVDKLMPVSADLGPLAAVLERAGRPGADGRFTAAEFGRALVQAAEKLPRPAPIPVVGVTSPGRDSSAWSGLPRPAAVDAGDADSASTAPTGPRPRAPITIGTTPVNAGLASAGLAGTRPLPEVASANGDGDDYAGDYAGDVPRRSKKWLIGGLAVIALAVGAIAYLVLKPDMATVPQLGGLEEGVALNEVAGDFDTLVEREPSGEVAEGLVIRTEPAAGESLEKGKTLVIIVSSGPPPSPLPELVGLTLEGARQELENVGLLLTEGEPGFSDEYAEGVVISWEVPDAPTLKAGDSVTQGTTVMVIISKGPAPRNVPELTGKSLEEATAILEDMGLVIFKGDDVFSPDVPVGMVAAFTPPKDTQVTIGDTVTVNLSKGPDLVILPAVTGLDYNGIIAALQNAGFTIGRVNGNVSLQFLSYSVNGVPATAGQQFPRDTAVELFFKSS